MAERTSAERVGSSGRSMAVRAVAAFGRFWWDFLIGDTPEIFGAVVVGLVGVWALVDRGHQARWAAAVLVIVVIGVLTWSVLRARPRRGDRSES